MLAKMREMLEHMLFLRSLRARIFVIILVVGIVPSVVMRYGIVNNYEERAVEHRITEVQNQLMILANHLIGNNYLTNYRSDELSHRNSRAVINAELEMLSNLYEGRVMIINSNLKVVKDTYGISEGKTIISEEVIKCFQGQNTAHYAPEYGYIELTIPITNTAVTNNAMMNGEQGKETAPQIQGVMLTSISTSSIAATMEILNRKAMILEILMIMIIFAGSIFLVSLEGKDLVTNFTAVTATINNIGPGLELVGPSQNFSHFNHLTKFVLMFDMLAGRLELFPMLILFHPTIWKDLFIQKAAMKRLKKINKSRQ